MGQFFSLEIPKKVKKLVKVVEIKVLLKEFIGVFEEPNTLPSFKRFDYKIPVKLSPYRMNIKLGLSISGSI